MTWPPDTRWMAVPFRHCAASSRPHHMRICFVCCEYPPAPHGGIGSVTRVLGRSLAATGHEVRAVGLYPELGMAPEEFDGDVHIWRIPMPAGRLGWTRGRRELFQTVSRWVERGEVDIVEVPD